MAWKCNCTYRTTKHSAKHRKIGNVFSKRICYALCIATRGDKMDNRAMIQQGLDYIEENLRTEITYKF